MRMVTLDFETYYSSDYSLSKMSTEEYVTDSRFEVIGVGIKHDANSYPVWYPQPRVEEALRSIDWSNTAVLCHNTMFDGLILAQRYGIYPKMYLDTMLMARAVVRPFHKSMSLAGLCRYLQLGQKGTEVVRALGKRFHDFSSTELFEYGRYCQNDTELTYRLFKRLMLTFPRDELLVIDRTLRMYLKPLLQLDAELLAAHLSTVQEEKATLLDNLPAGLTKDTLMSNEKFALALGELGVEPPMKVSPTTGKLTWAFSKQDSDFMALNEHEDSRVQALIGARIGHRSTLEETRTERLLNIARTFNRLRVPLWYYGAHTGRWSGTQGINLQNLPRGGKLRQAILAPDGYRLVVADFKQIEARVNAWLSNETRLLAGFAQKADVYSDFARVLYGVREVTDAQRFIGKTCVLGLGYGMGVDKLEFTLKSKGIKASYEEVKRMVWAYRGHYTMICGLWATMDVVISRMRMGIEMSLGAAGMRTLPQALLMPNGIPLHYHRLRIDQGGDCVYEYAGATKKLYGAKLVENIVQALARNIMTEAMLRIHYPMALTVHDELIFVVPEDEVGEAQLHIREEMTRQPEWAVFDKPEYQWSIPLDVSMGVGVRYGDIEK